MANYSTSQFKNGLKLMLGGNPCSIISNEIRYLPLQASHGLAVSLRSGYHSTASPHAQMNMRDALKKYGCFLANIRQFFSERAVVEVCTPQLLDYPVTDVYIDSIALQVNKDIGLKSKYLHTSPELEMKKCNHDYRVKMNAIDYIMITCNLKKMVDYRLHEKCSNVY
jgi:hypothetical protein